MPWVIQNVSIGAGHHVAGIVVSVGGRRLRPGEAGFFEKLPVDAKTLVKMRLVKITEVAGPSNPVSNASVSRGRKAPSRLKAEKRASSGPPPSPRKEEVKDDGDLG